MKDFLIKVTLFTLPFTILVSTYIVTDVFKVIFTYDPYYDNSYYLNVNRAYGSTMTYINQNPKYHYDSFILGNSRSEFFEIDTWKKYLPPNSRCMHFSESGGSISGIRDKIVFIDKHDERIVNVILVVDKSLLSRIDRENSEYLFISPPILKNYTNFFSFHYMHFKAFLNPPFLYALVDYNIFGNKHPGLISESSTTYLPEYNEFQFTLAEDRIRKGVYYDSEHVKVFEDVQKPGLYSDEIIGDDGISYLKEIKMIFDKHRTSYKIVISPLYDQIKLNRKTYSILCSIFGKDNVYDFSGPNKWNKDYHNYYENSHYRPHVAAEIMDIIYSKSQLSK